MAGSDRKDFLLGRHIVSLPTILIITFVFAQCGVYAASLPLQDNRSQVRRRHHRRTAQRVQHETKMVVDGKDISRNTYYNNNDDDAQTKMYSSRRKTLLSLNLTESQRDHIEKRGRDEDRLDDGDEVEYVAMQLQLDAMMSMNTDTMSPTKGITTTPTSTPPTAAPVVVPPTNIPTTPSPSTMPVLARPSEMPLVIVMPTGAPVDTEPTSTPVSPPPTTPAIPTTSPIAPPATIVPGEPQPTVPSAIPTPTLAPVAMIPTDAPTDAPVATIPTNTPTVVPGEPQPILPSPTLTPTSAPVVMIPTNAPTVVPEEPQPTVPAPVATIPTNAPTVTQSPTSPTVSPSAYPTMSCNQPTEQREQLMNFFISEVSDGLEQEEGTPQYEAREWIVNLDTAYTCPNDPFFLQRYILAAFYYSTEGEEWNECVAPSDFSDPSSIDDANDNCNISVEGSIAGGTDAWLTPGSECDWGGIVCNEDGYLVRLDIEDNNLKGSLPFELGNPSMASLQYLILESNVGGPIRGSIPATFGRLTNLKELDLNFNFIGGELPDELFNLTHLTQLDLNQNDFSGTLSSKIGQLSSLSFLQLDENRFSGAIPDELGSLVNLTIITLQQNNFNGTMPDSLCSDPPVVLTADCLGGPEDPPFVECSCCTQCF